MTIKGGFYDAIRAVIKHVKLSALENVGGRVLLASYSAK